MRLYGAIQKVEPQDDGTVKVHGIASTESVDDQGEVVRAAAMRTAIPDYMKFPALREMHQLSAAGTALELDCGDDGITRIVAHVVDPIAVTKVKTATYRGFSIGGRVTQREAGNPKTITGIVLNEISLVDRPANPEAIFDCWKAASMQTQPAPTGAAAFNPPIQIWACTDPAHRHLVKAEAMQCLETAATEGAAAQQAQLDAAVNAIQAGGDAGAQTDPPTPADAAPTEDPSADGAGGAGGAGEAAGASAAAPAGDTAAALVPGEIVLPADTAGFIAAVQQSLADGQSLLEQTAPPATAATKVDTASTPGDDAAKKHCPIAKSLYDVGRVASMILELNWVRDSLEFEAEIERDDSPQPARMAGIISELCGFLNALVAEETSELLADADDGDGLGMCMPPMAMSAVAASLRKTITDIEKVELLVELLEKVGARHNKSDQAHLDTIAFALHKAMGLGTAKRAELAAMGKAHKAVLDIGATALNADGRQMLTNSNPGPESPTTHATVDTGHAGRITTPNATGAVPATPHPPSVSKAAGASEGAGPAFLMIEAMAKSGKGHGPLAACAHDLLHAVSDGATCKEGTAKPTRHNVADMAMMHDLHAQLCMVDGVQCAGGEAPAAKVAATAAAPAEPVPAAAVTTDDGPLNKALSDNAALTKLLGDIVPVMKTMHDRIEQIAAQPMPAALVANVGATDATRSNTGTPTTVLTPDDIAKALKGMSEEESTLTLIKARRPLWINSLHLPPTQREARDELAARKA
jgi:hypothetical protein